MYSCTSQWPHIITVPHPRKDLGKGLVQALRKLAGLT